MERRQNSELLTELAGVIKETISQASMPQGCRHSCRVGTRRFNEK